MRLIGKVVLYASLRVRPCLKARRPVQFRPARLSVARRLARSNALGRLRGNTSRIFRSLPQNRSCPSGILCSSQRERELVQRARESLSSFPARVQFAALHPLREMYSYSGSERSARRREIHSPVQPANTDRLALEHGQSRLFLSLRGPLRGHSERIARGINTAACSSITRKLAPSTQVGGWKRRKPGPSK